MTQSSRELFHEAAQQGVLAPSEPWWKIQLFMWEPVLFGTWDGVFTSCMINIFGVVLFLRTGWLVGNTGVLLGLLLVSFVILVALITVLSGIGVGKRGGGMGSGGVYSMISSVLGGQVGGTVGLLYVFGQCVAGAMYITGFAESISDLLGLGNIWAVQGISIAVLLALLGINLAGVKWIIRLQLLLLFLLAVSTLDFVVGSFTHLDPGVSQSRMLQMELVTRTGQLHQITDRLSQQENRLLLCSFSLKCIGVTEASHGFQLLRGILGSEFKYLELCEHGFIGYSPELLQNNTLPDYSPGESFFTVFGVFFPAATGVMAGFNMGGDLREPAASIPLGSLAAVGISWFLYIVFTFLLGATCTRESLRSDFLIAEKVSLVGFLFLLGLYISSLASCMGGLYGAPRILQCIAQEKVIPALTFLGEGKGPNKTPVAAICLTSLVTMAFVLVGQVNILAPIVTINFMLTYIAVDYSYFSLSMDRDSLSQAPEPMPTGHSEALHCSKHLLQENAPSYGSEGSGRSLCEGTLLEFTKDMDQLFELTNGLEPGPGQCNSNPESQKKKRIKATRQTLQDSFLLDLNTSTSFATDDSDRLPSTSWKGQESPQNQQISRSESSHPGEACGKQRVPELCNEPKACGKDFFLKYRLQEQEVQRRPSSFYARMCNPWVSLLGAVGSLLIMFVIQWVYTLVSMGVAAIVYFYIGWASPGLYLGSASNFSFFRWVKSLFISNCRSLRSPPEQIILAPSPARVDMEMTQLTQENADFTARDRYHHSSLVSREQLMPSY